MIGLHLPKRVRLRPKDLMPPYARLPCGINNTLEVGATLELGPEATDRLEPLVINEEEKRRNFLLLTASLRTSNSLHQRKKK